MRDLFSCDVHVGHNQECHYLTCARTAGRYVYAHAHNNIAVRPTTILVGYRSTFRDKWYN